MKIDGIGGYWSGRASVVKGLSDEINIGTGALIRIGEARGKIVYLAFTPKGTRLGWMEPGEESGYPEEEKMLIKTIKEIQEESMSKAEADTDTWEPKGHNTRRCRDASRGTRDRGQPVYTTQDITLKKNSLNFVKCDITEDVMIERKASGLTGLEVVTALYAKGQDKIAVLNQRGNDVIIKKGVQIAEKRLVKPREADKRNADSADQTGIKKVHEDGVDRLAEIWDELGLEKNEVLKDKPRLKRKLARLLDEYQEVFSDPENMYGKTDMMEFSVELKEGTRPVKARCRPLNPKQKESLKQQLDLWKREDVIEESSSPWAAALVPCLKKGGETRWAVDY